MNWLVITVGGTPEVVVDTITHERPDRVYFLCSGVKGNVHVGSAETVRGRGMVCKSSNALDHNDLPSIPVQAGLKPEQWELSRFDIEADDLDDCYKKSLEAFKQIRDKDPGAQISADYTGGTKSMAGGLVLATVDSGHVSLLLERGRRGNLIHAEQNKPVSISVDSVYEHRTIEHIRELMRTYQYGAAKSIIEQLQRRSTSLDNKYELLHSFVAALDAWDAFEHAQAQQQFLEPEEHNMPRDVYQVYKIPLSKLVKAGQAVSEEDKSKKEPAWKTPSGYLLAADILANGGRRAATLRYDDAIGRNYRACELIAQTALWTEFGFDSGNPSPGKIPVTARLDFQVSADTPLGFFSAWDVLAALWSDKDVNSAVAKLWNERRSSVLDASNRRNASILAHGTRPVTANEYAKDMEKGMGGLAKAALKCLEDMGVVNPKFEPPEFPTDLPDWALKDDAAEGTDPDENVG